MVFTNLLFLLFAIFVPSVLVVYFSVKSRVNYLRLTKNCNFYALPRQFALCAVFWYLLLFIFVILANIIYSVHPFILVAVLLAGGGFLVQFIVRESFHAREHADNIIKIFFCISSMVSIVATVMITAYLLWETIEFFKFVPIHKFIFGLDWSPQTKMIGGEYRGGFGAVPVFFGTFLITFIAILIAAPLGLMSAIYLSEYASHNSRRIIKPFLEILSGVPTIVYGYFAITTVIPVIKWLGAHLGVNISSENALSAGLVMSIMIMPFIMSMSDDVMNAVPKHLKDASIAMGTTKSETIKQVVIPSALPGIISSILLAVSRAIGETMIVIMASGISANITLNPLYSVTTVTVQIVHLLVGDQEFDSPKTLSAFALGMTLFIFTFALNMVALYIVKKYRERYE